MRAIGNIPSNYCSDIWGYTAPDGHEFALVGKYNGTSIVDISTNPHNPVEVGFIPGVSSIWRDLKVYGNYCYVTNESGGGVDIIDISDPFNPVKVGAYTATFTTAHNIFITDGYAYIFGANSGSVNTRGCRILDVSTDPENPTEVGSWEGAYFHDGYVKNDTLYGSGIYDGSLYIVDVSDKSNPVTMVEHNYSNYGSHAVWVSGDSKYAITADEKEGGYIKIWDIRNFSNINLLATWYPNEPQVSSKSVHNVFWKDGLLYISYYVYGTRVVDMSDPSNPVEVGYYDFYPGDTGLYDGNWGTYIYTGNGLIYSTGSSGNGFFVMSYPFYGEIKFEEPADTEDNVSSIPIGVTITESPDYTVVYSSLKLYWGMNGAITDSVGMIHTGELYSADIVPAGTDGTMHYYVAFETTDGSMVTKPYDAPFSTFSFHVGTDQVAPVVHSLSNLEDQFYPNGEYTVSIEATDNIGVSTVELIWQVGDNATQSTQCSQVGSSNIYEGILSYSGANPGTSIAYWALVTDASSAANQTESETKIFYITNDYTLGNFEDASALNDWNLGTWGRQYVNSEMGFALNDSPGAIYEPDSENPCDLINPINLTYFDHAYFTFISGEMFGDGDFGYLQVKQGTDGLWSTRLTANGYNFMGQKYVNLDDYLNEEELFIRLLVTSDGNSESLGWFVDDIHLVLNQEMPIVGVEEDLYIPSEIVLHDAYPNPFNPSTTIQYSLPNAGTVDLMIYDLMGREVRSLVNAFMKTGTQSVIWDAKDDYGKPVSSGVYIYRLKTKEQMFSKKLILLK
jgi:choice-of-anchor B domain-containing protein